MLPVGQCEKRPCQLTLDCLHMWVLPGLQMMGYDFCTDGRWWSIFCNLFISCCAIVAIFCSDLSRLFRIPVLMSMTGLCAFGMLCMSMAVYEETASQVSLFDKLTSRKMWFKWFSCFYEYAHFYVPFPERTKHSILTMELYFIYIYINGNIE